MRRTARYIVVMNQQPSPPPLPYQGFLPPPPPPPKTTPEQIFTGVLLEETTVGPYRAVVPQLSGTAWITGFAQYVVDPEDPFPDGFTVGDIW